MSSFTLKSITSLMGYNPFESWSTKPAENPKSTIPKVRNASSIAYQILQTIGERHGRVWEARQGSSSRAILIADDTKDRSIMIKFLVADVSDKNSKGAGTFLVEKIKEQAAKTGQSIVLVSQNADAYWQNLGFRENPSDRTQMIWSPESSPAVDSRAAQRKKEKRGK